MFSFHHHTAVQLLLSNHNGLLHVPLVPAEAAHVPGRWTRWERKGTTEPQVVGHVLQLEARGEADVGRLADVQVGL